MKADQFGVVKMADGRLKSFRIVQVWGPGDEVHFCGRVLGPAPYRMVHLGGCLMRADNVLRTFDTETEARLFNLERELEDVRASLVREKEGHARSRKKLLSALLALASL